ncbi:MAG: hypothetical protein RIM84_17630 [Alphaproteobacteria bacterium]
MAKPKRSHDIHIELPPGISRSQVRSAVERAATAAGLYISHVGSYSRKKYPNSVHWHFKRDKAERGLIDATFWDVRSLFWLMIRFAEPDWVHDAVPRLRKALAREFAAAKSI